jgi:hypothetical protein
MQLLLLTDYKYDLLCNVVHDGLPGAGKGTYRIYVYHKVYHSYLNVYVYNRLQQPR